MPSAAILRESEQGVKTKFSLEDIPYFSEKNTKGRSPHLGITMGFGKDGKGAILRERVVSGALGALAAQDAVAFTGLVLTEDFRILKSEIIAFVSNLTPPEGSGLIFGIANGDLTAAEIEEAIEAAGPLDRNDRIPTEQAERNVKTLGVITDVSVTGKTNIIRNNEDGPMIESKHRWTYSNPEGWDWWIYNLGGSLTTGALLQLYAVHYGVWVV